MARRNRKSRKLQQQQSPKDVKPTAEELQQEKSFFMWTGIITVVVVATLYLLFF